MASGDSGFDWGELSRDWWIKTAAQIGASERHAMFAARKHAGASNTDAARDARFGVGSDGAARSEGYRLARSNRICQLLALAVAETGTGYDGNVSRVEARQILTTLARGSDPQIKIKSIELLNKLDKEAGGGTDASNLMPGDDIVATTLLGCNQRKWRPELWPLIWMEMILPRDAWWTPMLRQMVPYLKSRYPELWHGPRRKLADGKEEELRKLEEGPVLSTEQILEISLKNIMSLILVIDGNADPEARKTAFEDLKRNGLLEASFASA